MIRIQNLTFTPGADSRAALLCAAAKALRLAPDKITELRIHRRSVDARKNCAGPHFPEGSRGKSRTCVWFTPSA